MFINHAMEQRHPWAWTDSWTECETVSGTDSWTEYETDFPDLIDSWTEYGTTPGPTSLIRWLVNNFKLRSPSSNALVFFHQLPVDLVKIPCAKFAKTRVRTKVRQQIHTQIGF